MQFRKISSARSNSDQKRVRARLLVTLLILLVGVFIATVLWRVFLETKISKSSTNMESSSHEKQERTKNQSPIIRYESIEVDEPNVVRYSAYYVDDNNESYSTGKTVSVTDWIQLMAGQDSNELARNLTEILRCRDQNLRHIDSKLRVFRQTPRRIHHLNLH